MLLAVTWLWTDEAASETFAIGGGASLLSDQGSDANTHAFNKWGQHIFGEMSLGGFRDRQDGVLQIRFAHLSLPGGAPDAPDINAWSGLALVSYRFSDTWWQAGFFGGLGFYRILPKSPGAGQVPADPTQTVIGFAAGVQTLFRVTRKFDVRLELSWEYPQTDLTHWTIGVTTAVGYRF